MVATRRGRLVALAAGRRAQFQLRRSNGRLFHQLHEREVLGQFER